MDTFNLYSLTAMIKKMCKSELKQFEDLFNSKEDFEYENGNHRIYKSVSSVFLHYIQVYEFEQGSYKVELTSENRFIIRKTIEKAKNKVLTIDFGAMKTLGGSFEHSLATAYERADLENREKLLKTFPAEFGKFRK